MIIIFPATDIPRGSRSARRLFFAAIIERRSLYRLGSEMRQARPSFLRTSTEISKFSGDYVLSAFIFS